MVVRPLFFSFCRSIPNRAVTKNDRWWCMERKNVRTGFLQVTAQVKFNVLKSLHNYQYFTRPSLGFLEHGLLQRPLNFQAIIWWVQFKIEYLCIPTFTKIGIGSQESSSNLMGSKEPLLSSARILLTTEVCTSRLQILISQNTHLSFNGY